MLSGGECWETSCERNPHGALWTGWRTAVPGVTTHRTDQVGAQVRAEIMDIIQRDLKDPRIGFVSITNVRMSPDLRSARVRVSVLGDETQQRESLSGLRSATGLIRRYLGRRLENLKFSPELRFEIDPSIEYSVRISKRLREVLPPETESSEEGEQQ